MTRLHYACGAGDTRAVQDLLAAGVPVNASGADSCTPLHVAIYNENTETAKLLLAHGADPAICKDTGHNSIHAAAEKGNMDILKLVVNSRGPINAQTKMGSTAIMLAVGDGHARAVEYLLMQGADVSLTDNEGASPLYYGCQTGNAEIVELLLAGGAAADINKPMTSTACTCIMVAASHMNHECVRIMLEAGADVNHKSPQGFTPLLISREIRTMRLLVEWGANTRDVDCAGQGLLHKALYLGCGPEDYAYFVSKGADPLAIDNYGKMAATIALVAFTSGLPRVRALGIQQKAVVDGEATVVEHLCAHCFEKASLRCGRCKHVYYCSKACQKLNYKEHKLVCAVAQLKESEA